MTIINALEEMKAPSTAGEREALPMDTAPTDGTMIRLLVDFEGNSLEDTDQPVWTIGACYASDSEGDVWQFAGWNWSHDCFTEGHGVPIGWLPMIDTSQPADTKLVEQLVGALETLADHGAYSMSIAEPALAAGKQALKQTQGEATDWRKQAIAWIRGKAAEQAQTNQKYPRHAECYPSWVEKVHTLERLAGDLEAESESSPFGLEPWQASNPQHSEQPQDAASGAVEATYWGDVIGMFVERLNHGPQTTAASDVLALLNDCQYLASLAYPLLSPRT